MSPTATRNSQAAKHSAKTAESKPAAKKVVPPARKATHAPEAPVTKAKPAARVKEKEAVSKPVPKAAKREIVVPEVKIKSKPLNETTPIKKSLMVDVEKPKKKTESVAPPEKSAKPELYAAEKPPKKKAVKAEPEAKSVKALKPAPEPVIVPPVVAEEPRKSTRGRKPKSETAEPKPARQVRNLRTPKVKPLDPLHEFLSDDMPAADDIEEEDVVIPEDLSELDPLDLPLALLDPELVDVPRTVGPQRPKPKPRTERTPKKCASCGQMFTWLSVDQVCFNCLKRKLAAKKREDEAYGGFTPEPEEDGDD